MAEKIDLKALKKRISEETSKLEKEIAELEQLTKPVGPENAIGRVSRMDAINNKSVNEAALRTKQDTLINLEIAMSRINEPGFGICVKCKQPIPEGRLMLMPGSTKCVNCA